MPVDLCNLKSLCGELSKLVGMTLHFLATMP